MVGSNDLGERPRKLRAKDLSDLATLLESQGWRIKRQGNILVCRPGFGQVRQSKPDQPGARSDEEILQWAHVGLRALSDPTVAKFAEQFECSLEHIEDLRNGEEVNHERSGTR
jgi:hypothetical protein